MRVRGIRGGCVSAPNFRTAVSHSVAGLTPEMQAAEGMGMCVCVCVRLGEEKKDRK